MLALHARGALGLVVCLVVGLGLGACSASEPSALSDSAGTKPFPAPREESLGRSGSFGGAGGGTGGREERPFTSRESVDGSGGCEPRLASPFVGRYHPPAFDKGACTVQQLDEFESRCRTKDQGCSDWLAASEANRKCYVCSLSGASAPTWSLEVALAQPGFAFASNEVPLCLDLLGGTPEARDCARKYQGAVECALASCGGCVVPEGEGGPSGQERFRTCMQKAFVSTCRAQAVELTCLAELPGGTREAVSLCLEDGESSPDLPWRRRSTLRRKLCASD